MTKTIVLAKASTCFAALAIGFCAASSAALAAELRGRVIDDTTKAALPGATVSVQGTEISVTTGRDGTFLVSNLKPGSYTLNVDYVGYPDMAKKVAVGAEAPASIDIALVNGETIETVTVTGSRQAERVALQLKKSSDGIIDMVYANDVGKLPDQNVAEAVRRLPGVSVATDQGEGRYAIIRGAAPNLANVTVNGQTAPAPEPDGRQIKLDDIPASLIGSLTVSKTLTPDLDANAIAGQIDISTVSAFDRPGGFFNLRFASGTYNLSGQSPYEVDLSGGHTFGPDGQFGIVVAGNLSTRPITSENFGSGGPTWAPNYATIGGVATNAVTPNNMQIRDYSLTRIRSGAVFNFDWHATENLDLFLRTTYSSFSDKETRDRFTIAIPVGTSSKPVTSYTSLDASTGAFTTGGTGTRYVRSREEDDHTINFSAGGKYTAGENIFKLEGTWSQAIKTDPRRDEWTFKSGSTISGTYDLSQFLYLVTPDATAYDPSKYAFSQVVHANREAAENLYQLRGDYERALPILDGDSTVKAGFKWAERVKNNDQEQQTFKASKSTMTMATTVSGTPIYTNGKVATYSGRFAFGPRVDYATAESYFITNHGTRACDTSTAGGFACDVNASISSSNSGDYRVQEDLIAGYVMANIKIGKLQLTPGVRVESTDGSYGAKIIGTQLVGGVATITITPNTQTRSYTDVFPGINARYDITDDLVLRGAVTTAIGRPDYASLPAYVVVDTTSSPATVSQGNPALKPLKSRNFDLSAEYYLPGQGVIAVAAFYKDIDDPIYSQQLTNQTGTFGGYALTGANVSSFNNAMSAEIKGVEINLQEQFAFLPSPFDGLGASANIAMIDSLAKGLWGRTDTVPLFDQSKYVGTAQVFYEKYGFTARLAYSYRSKFLDTVGGDKTTDVYTMANGQLDARLSYDLSENVSVFVEGANLNGARWRRFIGNAGQAYESERYSWSSRVGLQLKL